MPKSNLLLACILLLLSTTTYGGFSSYSGYNNQGSVMAAVEIEGKGIYNLVISVQFLSQPFDKKPYSSDAYEELLKRLSVEWKGVVLKEVLINNLYKVTDLGALKEKVKSAIQKQINSAKNKYGIDKDAEVVFSVGSFYLVDTK